MTHGDCRIARSPRSQMTQDPRDLDDPDAIRSPEAPAPPPYPRDSAVFPLKSNTTDFDSMTHLALASGLFQTIGMFHKDPEQRAKSNVYHGMIVMVRPNLAT